MKMIELESMAVEMPQVEGHPNRVAFRGVLTIVDAPSQRPPSGAKGHRVLLTREAAEAALPSLLGMALDYDPQFDRHDARRKVGVITSAEIVGKNLEVGGYLYAKDFPEIVEEVAKWGRRPATLRERHSATWMQGAVETGEGARLRALLAEAAEEIRSGMGKQPEPGELRAGSGAGAGLGMSFEVTDTRTVDVRARVWVLTRVTFTGAAVLRRDKAAYADTWIELSSR